MWLIACATVFETDVKTEWMNSEESGILYLLGCLALRISAVSARMLAKYEFNSMQNNIYAGWL